MQPDPEDSSVGKKLDRSREYTYESGALENQKQELFLVSIWLQTLPIPLMYLENSKSATRKPPSRRKKTIQ